MTGADSEPGCVLGGRRGAIGNGGEVGHEVTNGYIRLGLDGGLDEGPGDTRGGARLEVVRDDGAEGVKRS